VLGAMKCGTTTLYHDLLALPGVRLPDKESNALLAADPERVLAQLFAGAGPGEVIGEVCPDYTKPGLGDRALAAARRLFASHQPPKLIYLVREPIARLLSHHHFVSTQHGEANPGGMTADLAASLRDFPELVATSCYAARLGPWLDAFGRETVKVIRFEDYVADRVGTLADLADFLGLGHAHIGEIDTGRVHNAGDSRPVATPGWRRVLRQPLYRQWLRPLLPRGLRDRLRAWLLPKPPPRPAPPGPETLAALAEIFQPDVEMLSHLIGADRPLWDLGAVVKLRSEAPSQP
jgi:hypothetical protein